MRLYRWLMITVCAVVGLAAWPAVVGATPMYLVSANTSNLVGAGTFYLDFQLNDGGGPVADNTVNLTAFGFGGGSAAGAPIIFGSASGNVGTGVTLVDSAFTDFTQAFLPGTAVSFLLGLPTNQVDAPPDLFTLAILDDTFAEIQTFDFYSSFLSVSFDGVPTISTFASSDPTFTVDAPTVEAVSDLPEPTTLLLVGTALTGLAARARRRRSSSA